MTRPWAAGVDTEAPRLNALDHRRAAGLPGLLNVEHHLSDLLGYGMHVEDRRAESHLSARLGDHRKTSFCETPPSHQSWAAEGARRA